MADIATSRSPALAKDKLGATERGSRKNLKKNGPKVDDAQSQAHTNEEEEDRPTETAEGVGQDVEKGEEGEEGEEVDEGDEGDEGYEGSEAIPVGSVDADGKVVDEEGNVLGKVERDVPEGSLVDTEGDVLDAEGNVIGKADLEDAAKDLEGTADEAAEGAEKPKLVGPFGVQDNGEVTNAAGVPIGKLTEGSPKDLVGQSIEEIDKEGNLKAETGSTVGKAELNPEVFEEGDHAVRYLLTIVNPL
jgi:hypothetical protein